MWFSRKVEEPRFEKPFPVEPGQRFRWLGVDMIVTATGVECRWEEWIRFVSVEYVNANGDIRCRRYYPVEWDALAAEIHKVLKDERKGD